MDEILTRTDASGARSNLADALGSPIALADAAGSEQTQYSYEPFGQTTTAGAANSNQRQYTGRENDGTGMYPPDTAHRKPPEDPCGGTSGGRGLDDVLRSNDRTFQRYLESLETQAAKTGSADTERVLLEAAKRGWLHALRGPEYGWVGGYHVNLPVWPEFKFPAAGSKQRLRKSIIVWYWDDDHK